MNFGLFCLCALLYFWFFHKAAQHRKNPDQVFYLGNVAPAGRKYVWLAFAAWFVAIMMILRGILQR